MISVNALWEGQFSADVNATFENAKLALEKERQREIEERQIDDE